MSKKANQICIDEAAVLDGLRQYFVSAMERAEERLIEIMKEEIHSTENNGISGKESWRTSISGLQKEVYREITNDVIKMDVGIDEAMKDSAENLFVKAVVIAYGNTHNGPIHAGPTGRPVWDDEITTKHGSRAKTEYGIPQFNLKGNHFIENAVARMVKHFKDVIEDACRNLDSSVFYDNVHIKEAR